MASPSAAQSVTARNAVAEPTTLQKPVPPSFAKRSERTLPRSPGELRQLLIRNFVWTVGFLSVLVFIYAGVVAWRSWQAERVHFEEHLATVVALEAESIDRYFINLQAAMKSLGEDLAVLNNPRDLNLAYRAVQRFGASRPDLFNVALTQPDGRVLLTAKTPPDKTSASLASQDSFKEFITQLERGQTFAVGRPVMGAVLARFIVPVRHAVLDNAGRVRYIISASLPQEYLRSFWMNAPITGKAAIGVMRDDGFLLSRYPVPNNLSFEEVFGRPRTGALINFLQKSGFPQSGIVLGPSSLDGPDFLNAFRRLPHFPATVFIAMPYAEIRAAWWQRFQATFYLSVMLLITGSAAAYSLRRREVWQMEQDRIEAALRLSEEQMSASEKIGGTGSWTYTLATNTIRASAQTLAIFGYSSVVRDRPLGDFLACIPERERVRKTLEDAIGAGRAYDDEYTIKPADGSPAKIVRAIGRHEFGAGDNPLKIVGFIQDITERKQAEHSLFRESEKNRVLLQNASDGIHILDVNGNVVEASKSFCDMLGYTREELIGAHVSMWDRGFKDGDELAAALRGLLECRGRSLFQTLHRRKDGSIFNVEVSAFALELEGDPVVFTSSRDITDRMQAEDALKEAEYLYRSLANGISTLIWKSGPDKLCNFFNEPWLRFTGRTLAQEMGNGWAEGVHPDDMERCLHIYVSAFDRREPFSMDYRLRCADGSYRWISDDGKPTFDSKGEFLGYIGACNDITGRKNAELALQDSERFVRATLDSLSANIAILDESGMIIAVNRDWHEFAIANAAEAVTVGVGANYLAVCDAAKEAGSEMAAGIRAVLANTLAEFQMEYPCDTPQRKIWFLCRVTRFQYRDTNNAVVVHEDITLRKAAEEAIQNLNSDLERRVRERTLNLEEANRELEAFSYSIAHDLRTPLRSISSFARVIEQDCAANLDEEGIDALRRVQVAAQNMGQLIEGLLRLARLSRTEIEVKPVDLHVLATEIFDQFRAAEPERRVAVEIAPEIVVNGDRQMLAALLNNLLGNAWKFTANRAGARIEVGVSQQDGAPVYYVRDNGAGFDMAYVGNLFRPFHRLHSASEFAGTGIGLATVQRIVQRHGGSVWAEGAIENGATIYFTLQT